ncbi:MAG: UDP-3-O-(3-hydroxymyristoyl)glucosamine N-acyltransferase [Bacteroidales bacterium]|nr:UDP-3-O-(3-hydroxymyristoyl)glucosamine N-acyltransferase [Bacteroidales bacterium]
MEITAKQLASYLSGEIEGDPDVSVNTISKIEEGLPGTLTFLANPKYAPYIYTTKASIVLVNKDFTPEQPIEATLIRVENAYQCLAQLLTLVDQAKGKKTGIGSVVSIDSTATLGENIYIGNFACVGKKSQIGNDTQIYPHVFIGDGVKVGSNCILYPGVKIYDECVIGNNCILQAGAIIGGDGFGFAPKGTGDYQKIPQIGNVIIEDDVEIGANTTVDRATMGSTIVHRGVKLDNMIQVAHNVEIGENTVIAAQTGISGSTKLGRNCMIGGQVGFAGHIHIADGIQIAAQSGISNNLTDNTTPYMGYPAMPAKQYARAYVVYKKLPDLAAEVSRLGKEIEELKKSIK